LLGKKAENLTRKWQRSKKPFFKTAILKERQRDEGGKLSPTRDNIPGKWRCCLYDLSLRNKSTEKKQRRPTQRETAWEGYSQPTGRKRRQEGSTKLQGNYWISLLWGQMIFDKFQYLDIKKKRAREDWGGADDG